MSHQAKWTVVFAVNLPAPLFFAGLTVSQMGWIGVALVVVAYWVAGLYRCRKDDTITSSLINGGVIVGISQLFPILHIFIGGFGIYVANLLGLRGSESLSLVAATIATTITGGGLLAIALAVGRPFALRSRQHSKTKPLVEAEPMFDRQMGG